MYFKYVQHKFSLSCKIIEYSLIQWVTITMARHGAYLMPVKLLTVKESADQLGLSARTVWAWIYARKLGVVRLGRSVRISQTAIDDLIQAGSVPARVR
jgi:excisionase family DNA binding protein